MSKKRDKEQIKKNLGGRPPKFTSVEKLDELIEDYFDIKGTYSTITGLALHLGFCSRQSLYDYLNNPKFSYSIRKALTHVESNYELRLHSNTCTGSIFALKNFGWKDKSEIEHKGSVPTHNVIDDV